MKKMEVPHGDATITLGLYATKPPGASPDWKPERMFVAASHTVRDQAVRVLAVNAQGDVMGTAYFAASFDREGQEHFTSSGFVDKSGRIEANGLLIADIHEFQFQVSPYEWAEFKNVALQPDAATRTVQSP